MSPKSQYYHLRCLQ